MIRLPRMVQPWHHYTGVYASPTSLLVRLKSGETPDHLPAALDVRQGVCSTADRTGHGAFDRVASTFGGAVRISRLHSAKSALLRVGERNRNYTNAEEACGISRVLRLDVEPGTHVGSMAISLRQLDIVESATPNYLVALGMDEPLSSEERDNQEHTFGSRFDNVRSDDQEGWLHRDAINGRQALAREPGDPAVIVAVVDSGVNPNHREFSRGLRSGFDTVQLGHDELAGGIALLGDNAGADVDPSDRHVGHGTGCAGIIGAAGQHIPPGMAGECQVLPIRSLGAALFPGKKRPVGVGAISDLDAGVVMAVQLGAKVINMSFGTDDASLDPTLDKPHREAVEFATAQGCTLVAAAGNSGDRRTYWPAAFPEVVAVGSVSTDGTVSEFSTSGDHVALCAPGERVRTAHLEGYQRATGTSFAAPFVASVAALLHSRAQRRSAPLSPHDVKTLLTTSARTHREGNTQGHGVGILDGGRALAMLDEAIDADPSVEFGGTAHA